jgi:hypothetical protein
MKYGLIITCVLLSNPAMLVCRELTGTVYSEHSGPSGRGTGFVKLSTNVGIVSIRYQKPIQGDLKSQACYELGAIWTVDTKRLDGEDELVRVRCDGRLDTHVHSAWLAVLRYLQNVAESDGQKIGFDRNRRGPVTVNIDDVRADISGYLNFPGNGMCLEVKNRTDTKRIVITSSAECYFTPDLDFTVELVGSSEWHVTGVRAVPPRH